MMLVLTYHKVRETAAAGASDFYTVSPGQLSRHIDTLDGRGFKPLKIEELVRHPDTPGNNYILSFDDGTLDHYETVFPILQQHHRQGVFFIPTAKLNKPGYMTNSQVQELVSAGHAIGFHSHEHRRLDLLSEEEARRQVSLSQKIIADIIGSKPVLFVPPGGFINARIQKVAVELGVQAMRTMRWGYNKSLDLMALETIPLNHSTNDKRFLSILEAKNSWFLFLYNGKETLKRFIPLRSYEFLRGLVFKRSKSD
jgi:peptidoglycan/xylan/chitin deacetylase (PgdA/CDA1 family)